MQEVQTKPQVKEVHKYRLTPAALFTGEMPVICQYTDSLTGQVMTLQDGGRYGFPTDKPFDAKLFQIKMLSFSKERPFFEIEVNPNNAQDEGLKVVNFWKRHPKVGSRNGEVNPNAEGQPLMYLENLTTTKGDQKGHVLKIKQAIEKYNSLSERSQKNVGYLFGITGADSMDETDLYLQLANPMNGVGIILQPGANIEKFLAYQPDDEDAQMQINVRRAIERGLVKREGSTFLVNNSPVATDENGVIAYFKNNQDFYSRYVVDALGEAAEKQRIEKKKEQDAQIVTHDPVQLKQQCQDLYNEGKELGIVNMKVKNWNGFTRTESMLEAIAEAKQMIADKRTRVQTENK